MPKKIQGIPVKFAVSSSENRGYMMGFDSLLSRRLKNSPISSEKTEYIPGIYPLTSGSIWD